MTFLAPSNLWFLFAVGIPIIIHVFSRLRTKTIKFSSIRYIKQLETSSIRKVKIQELRDAGKKAHSDGDHSESEKLLNEALSLISS